MKNLAGKVVVITGAGSGIGQALARVIATRGAILVLVDIDWGEHDTERGGGRGGMHECSPIQ